MKTRKRYFTRQHILDEIDNAKAKAQALKVQAEQLDIHADELVKQDMRFFEDAAFARTEANKARKAANRIETVKLPKLGQKLSEFDTMTLPGVEVDPSIQA